MSIQAERDRPAAEAEIEVTAEMIEAGVRAYFDNPLDVTREEEMVAEVYRAMLSIREGLAFPCVAKS